MWIVGSPSGSALAREMKKIIIKGLLVGACLLLLAGGLLYSYVSREGYPTMEAMRNRLLSDGKIVIVLPSGFPKIASAICDDESAKVDILHDKVIVHVGYTWCSTAITAPVGDGTTITLVVNSQKLNNWNTIRYVPQPSSSNGWQWAKFENGVKLSHNDITIKRKEGFKCTRPRYPPP